MAIRARERESHRSPEPVIREPLWSFGLAASLVVLGALALLLPHPSGLGIATIVSWVLLLAGAAHLALGWKSSTAGAVAGRLLIGLAYLAGAIYLLADPDLSQSVVRRLFAAIFVLEGAALVSAYFRNRTRRGAVWILVDGVATLVIAGLIWAHWPSGTLWSLAALVGSNILVSGVAVLLITSKAKLGGDDILGAKRH
jgi:uncharacterized membrane protein HdeD (DUF308 family)